VYTLIVSRTLTDFGDRAFGAAGPRVWNCLPTDLRRPALSYVRWIQLLSGTTAHWKPCLTALTSGKKTPIFIKRNCWSNHIRFSC